MTEGAYYGAIWTEPDKSTALQFSRQRESAQRLARAPISHMRVSGIDIEAINRAHTRDLPEEEWLVPTRFERPSNVFRRAAEPSVAIE
jgi:hypothetical protein